MKHDACWITTENGDIVMAVGAMVNSNIAHYEEKRKSITLLGVGGHKVAAIFSRPEAEAESIMDALRQALLDDQDVDVRDIIKELESPETKDNIVFPYRCDGDGD